MPLNEAMYEITETPGRQASPEDIRRLLYELLQQEIVAVDATQLEELMALIGEGVRSERRVAHELRVKEFEISETAATRSMTVRQFKAVLDSNLAHCLRELNVEQGNCSWRIVAAKVSRSDGTGIESGPGPAASDGHWGDILKGGPNKAVEQRVTGAHRRVEHIRLRITLVYADMAGADVSDPNMVWGAEGVAGEMTKYAETRQIRHLPHGMRIQRELAEALLREFYATPAPEPSAVAIETPPIQIPEAKPPSTRRAQSMAAKVREQAGRGIPPAAIAAALGIELAEVNAVLDG
jgi:hypothetical protein